MIGVNDDWCKQAEHPIFLTIGALIFSRLDQIAFTGRSKRHVRSERPTFLERAGMSSWQDFAYQNWEGGRPLGSPDIDWFAAEQALYQSLDLPQVGTDSRMP